jgi:hypothetical protein
MTVVLVDLTIWYAWEPIVQHYTNFPTNRKELGYISKVFYHCREGQLEESLGTFRWVNPKTDDHPCCYNHYSYRNHCFDNHRCSCCVCYWEDLAMYLLTQLGQWSRDPPQLQHVLFSLPTRDRLALLLNRERPAPALHHTYRPHSACRLVRTLTARRDVAPSSAFPACDLGASRETGSFGPDGSAHPVPDDSHNLYVDEGCVGIEA